MSDPAATNTATREPVSQTTVTTLDACDPQRYGKQGVIRCPNGCVTQCEKERRDG